MFSGTRHSVFLFVAASLLMGVMPVCLLSQETDEEQEEEGIRDNSFLIEEAYNQEPGVVQTILNAIPSWDHDGGIRHTAFDFVFTQEWPVFSQRHQFSYSLPMLYSAERAEDNSLVQAQGFGDLFLNYRYQLSNGEGPWPAMAPRFSTILRTGEGVGGCKCDKVGYQLNLPVSKEFEHWAVHGNAGWTSIRGLQCAIPELPPVCRAINGYNLGGSVIRFVRPNFHLMLESVAFWNAEVTPQLEEENAFEWILSPGFRWAPYTQGSTQWVVGMGVPVGLTRDAPDVGLFLYMSMEQRFWKERK